MSQPLRLAHRGDWRRAPENSIPALLAALEVPACDGLELDVRAARDGTPVLLHDPTLWRVQRRRMRVDAMDPDALATHGVPTLDAALAAVDAVRSEAFVDVELKDDPGPRAIDVLEAHRGAELAQAVVSSFRVSTLEAVRAARPGWPCWLNAHDLTSRTIDLATRLGCSAISVRWSALDERSVGRARERGLELAAWTVRDLATFERIAALGVRAVCVEAAALDG